MGPGVYEGMTLIRVPGATGLHDASRPSIPSQASFLSVPREAPLLVLFPLDRGSAPDCALPRVPGRGGNQTRSAPTSCLSPLPAVMNPGG